MAKTKTPKSKKTKAKTAAKRRLPKRLSQIFYCYVEPRNGVYAREYGKKNFGSFSAYVDALIASDRREKFLSVPVTISKLKEQTKKKTKKATKKPAKKAAVKKVKKPGAVKTETQGPTTTTESTETVPVAA